MCKYCKKLREIKDLDEKRYLSLISKWRFHVFKAEKIMTRAIDAIQEALGSDELTEEDVVDLENCVSEMSSWISVNFIGK